MAKFRSAIDLFDNLDGTYNLEYTIFSPRKTYAQAKVEIVQIEKFDDATKALPGLKIEILFEEISLKDPLVLNGNIQIDPPFVIDLNRPFVEVEYFVWDAEKKKKKEKGGAIVRGHIPA